MKLSPEFQYLRPFKSELIRVGPKGDCGYVIPKSVAEKTNGMYSIGISTNWEFEVEMAKRNPKLKISAFDRTSGWTVFAFVGLRDLLRGDPSESEKMMINVRIKSAIRYFNLSLRFRFFFSGRKKFERKWVRESSSLKSEISFADSIHGLFDKDEVMLKIDIEGAEYLTLPKMSYFLKEQKPIVLLSIHNMKTSGCAGISGFFKMIFNRLSILKVIGFYKFQFIESRKGWLDVNASWVPFDIFKKINFILSIRGNRELLLSDEIIKM